MLHDNKTGFLAYQPWVSTHRRSGRAYRCGRDSPRPCRPPVGAGQLRHSARALKRTIQAHNACLAVHRPAPNRPIHPSIHRTTRVCPPVLTLYSRGMAVRGQDRLRVRLPRSRTAIRCNPPANPRSLLLSPPPNYHLHTPCTPSPHPASPISTRLAHPFFQKIPHPSPI